MTTTSKDAWAAILAYLKSKTSITSLLLNGGATEIRERQWMGEDFEYPAIRVSLDFFPSINGCGPDDLTAHIQVFSEQKSSQECQIIAGALETLLHKKPFKINGLDFPVVVVKEIPRPTRPIYAWETDVQIRMQVV